MPSENSSPPEAPEEAPARPRGRTVKDVEADSPVQLPQSLDVLWTPSEGQIDSSRLPAAEILDEVAHKLHVTLHPQTQHRSVYPAAASGQKVEPTLGLYCPIEGGDYVIDATVKELARRTGADVLVIDAVQIAAGKWGIFGEGSCPFTQQDNDMLSLECTGIISKQILYFCHAKRPKTREFKSVVSVHSETRMNIILMPKIMLTFLYSCGLRSTTSKSTSFLHFFRRFQPEPS